MAATAISDAGKDQMGFSRRVQFAHFLHRRFRLDGALVNRLGDRFERLLVGRVVLEELGPVRRVEPCAARRRQDHAARPPGARSAASDGGRGA